MDRVNWKIVGGFAIVLLAFILLGCGHDGGLMRQCVRSNVIGAVGYVLMLGSLALGAWIGSATAGATGRTWLGWCVGLAVTLGLAFGLEWIGMLPELHTPEW